jgi:cytochrome c oxidase cbb3-type subunit 3
MSEEPRELPHDYDGIREYDNPLPSWWSGIFILTIVFAVVYAIWYGPGPGRSMHEEFEAEWAGYSTWKAEAEAKATIVVDESTLTTLAADSTALDRGRQLFSQNCIGCHLEDGRGQTGPNLTDEYQIHGMTRLDLYNTIRDGVPAKGMISWGATMQPKDMAAVAAFVSTLRGKNIPGKGPEGGKVSALR